MQGVIVGAVVLATSVAFAQPVARPDPLPSATTQAEPVDVPTVEVGLHGVIEDALYMTLSLNLAASVHLANWLYADGEVLLVGREVGEGTGTQHDQRMYGGALGVSARRWYRRNMLAARATVGYLNSKYNFRDYDGDPHSYRYSSLYAGLEGIAGVRYKSNVIFEFAFGFRKYVKAVDDGSIGPTFGAGVRVAF